MYGLLLFLHVLAATIWTGGHLVLSVVVLPRVLKERSPSVLLPFELVYEKIGMPALAVQVVTGLTLAKRDGVADAFDLVARTVWIHAFTVGALGMTMLSFANRVALRHTGRMASATTLAIAGLLIMFAAGVVRLIASLADHRTTWMILSAAAWSLPFALFLIEHGAKLWRKSLPRNGEAVALTADARADRPWGGAL